jgi:hypothetical protein
VKFSDTAGVAKAIVGSADSLVWHAGTGISLTYLDDTVTITATGGSGATDSFKLGHGMLGVGTYILGGESLAVDDTVIPTFQDLSDSVNYYATDPPIAGWGVEIHNDTAGHNRISVKRADTDTAYLAAAGKAANATKADSAAIAARSYKADSSTGGATRATTAQSLQGKDTTALWNAKTLQGKDTTALKAMMPAFADTMWYTKQTLTTSSGHVAWNLANGGYGRVLMPSNDTMNNPTNVRNGRTYRLKLIQDGTGSRLMAWGTNYRFPGAVAPTLTATRMKADIITFIGDEDSLLIRTGAVFSITTGDTL